jgi:hypothetical protein
MSEDIPEKILKSRLMNRGLQYFVKWKGFPDCDGSWEAVDKLKEFDNSTQLIKDFEEEDLKIQSKNNKTNAKTKVRSKKVKPGNPKKLVDLSSKPKKRRSGPSPRTKHLLPSQEKENPILPELSFSDDNDIQNIEQTPHGMTFCSIVSSSRLVSRSSSDENSDGFSSPVKTKWGEIQTPNILEGESSPTTRESGFEESSSSFTTTNESDCPSIIKLVKKRHKSNERPNPVSSEKSNIFKDAKSEKKAKARPAFRKEKSRSRSPGNEHKPAPQTKNKEKRPAPWMDKEEPGSKRQKGYKRQDDEVEEVAEKILDRRYKKHKFQYLIKWQGFSPEDATWEEFDEIKSKYPDMVKKFEQFFKQTKKERANIKSLMNDDTNVILVIYEKTEAQKEENRKKNEAVIPEFNPINPAFLEDKEYSEPEDIDLETLDLNQTQYGKQEGENIIRGIVKDKKTGEKSVVVWLPSRSQPFEISFDVFRHRWTSSLLQHLEKRARAFTLKAHFGKKKTDELGNFKAIPIVAEIPSM